MIFPEAPLVKVCGDSIQARVEETAPAENIDHVWITLDCGIGSRVLVSVNTRSLRNFGAGYDGRVRMGHARGTCRNLPERGVHALDRYDYATVESEGNIFFEHFERMDAEKFLLDQCRVSHLLEAWGMPYRRRAAQHGLHQIHCRRSSCAVPLDVVGHDGGLRFFQRTAEGVEWTLVLMKFCGQP